MILITGATGTVGSDWAQAHRTELLTPEAVQNAATVDESR